jgi:hypothetical protein
MGSNWICWISVHPKINNDYPEDESCDRLACIICPNLGSEGEGYFQSSLLALDVFWVNQFLKDRDQIHPYNCPSLYGFVREWGEESVPPHGWVWSVKPLEK